MKKISLVFIAICIYFICRAFDRKAKLGLTFEALDSIPLSKPVIPIINEGSGIADSKRNPGYLWVEEDSGNPPILHLLKHDGKVLKQVFIKGATNRDWEDICLAAGNIYVGDIGDNAHVYDDYIIYRFNEPLGSVDTIQSITKIRFKYADGPRDAEAFLVDPVTKDIFIITKRDNPSRVYKFPYPYNSAGLNIAQQVASLSYSGVVSAALSPSGKEIILKTYIGLQYYKRSPNQSISEALKNKFTTLPYKHESLGEAVCFAINGSGYFTLSERGFGSVVNLYFYSMKWDVLKDNK